MPQANVLVVTADLDIAYEGHQQPVARVMAKPGAPFVGLFAFGRSFAAARNALARAVWEQSQMVRDRRLPDDVSAVRVVASLARPSGDGAVDVSEAGLDGRGRRRSGSARSSFRVRLLWIDAPPPRSSWRADGRRLP